MFLKQLKLIFQICCVALLVGAGAVSAENPTLDQEAEYRRALELDPSSTEARYNLAVILQNKGSIEEAKQLYRSVIQRSPNHAGAYFQLGTIYYGEKDFPGAIDAFGQASHINPKMTAAHYNLGLVYIEARQFEKAREALKRAITLDPGNAMAFYNIAYAYEQQGFTDEAEMGYVEALKLNPNLMEARDRLEALKSRGSDQNENGGEGTGGRSIPLLGGSFGGGGGFQMQNPLNSFGSAAGDNTGASGFNSKGLLLQAGTALLQQWFNSRSQSSTQSQDSNQ